MHSYLRTALVVLTAASTALAIPTRTIETDLDASVVGEIALASPFSTACSAVHILSGRGSTETVPEGSMETLAALIQSSYSPTSAVTRESVTYPATLQNYASSSAQGTKAVTKQLTAYVNRCPDAKIVLLGYSQGAQIILDSLCGGGDPAEGLGPETPPISQTIGNKVAAIVLYGDPRRVPGQSYDKGTATTSGAFPRLSSQSCSHYASKIASYCDAGDPVCASGNDLSVHVDHYPAKYDAIAEKFVAGKIKA